MTSAQIGALSTLDVSSLTPTQLGGFTYPQAMDFSLIQLHSLNQTQFRAL